MKEKTTKPKAKKVVEKAPVAKSAKTKAAPAKIETKIAPKAKPQKTASTVKTTEYKFHWLHWRVRKSSARIIVILSVALIALLLCAMAWMIFLKKTGKLSVMAPTDSAVDYKKIAVPTPRVPLPESEPVLAKLFTEVQNLAKLPGAQVCSAPGVEGFVRDGIVAVKTSGAGFLVRNDRMYVWRTGYPEGITVVFESEENPDFAPENAPAIGLLRQNMRADLDAVASGALASSCKPGTVSDANFMLEPGVNYYMAKDFLGIQEGLKIKPTAVVTQPATGSAEALGTQDEVKATPKVVSPTAKQSASKSAR